MTSVIQGATFRWTDSNGKNWKVEEGFLLGSSHTHEIATRVRELVYGSGPMATEAEREFFSKVRTIANEVLLSDLSVPDEEAKA